MAKMIKHKDSFVATTMFATMLKRVNQVNKINDNSCFVLMEDQHRSPIEVKTPYSTEKVIETIENNQYEGEIAGHLFSYYIGEI
jgi:hypothetical protein